jgi:phage portal protein BeeE
MRNPVVHRCVRMIAEAAAAVPWIAHDGPTEVPDHPLLALIERPNTRDTRAGFLETLYGHLLLSGNAYAERAEPDALWLLRPDRVSVVTGPDGWPVGGRLPRRRGQGGASRFDEPGRFAAAFACRRCSTRSTI